MRAVNLLAAAMPATAMSATVGLVSVALGADATWPTTMRARNPEAFKEAGATIGGSVPADDGKYQVIRDLNETAKRPAAQK
jgi:hypothetical protein